MKFTNLYTVILLFITMVFTQNLYATTYYVSSSSGNDSNNGITPNYAWETLSNLYSFEFQPGDSICFKRGDVWYNQSLRIRYRGTAEHPITYSDYGTGNLPEILEIGTLDNTAVWTDEGDNIWSINIDDALVPNWNYFHKLQRLYVDGTEVLGAALSIPSELGTNIPDLVRFYYNQGTQTLKLFSTANPNTLNIEFAFEQYALDFVWWAGTDNKVQYINIENLKFSGGNVSCVNIVAGIHINFSNLDIGDKGNFGLSISGGDEASSNIVIDSCLIDSKYTFDYTSAGTVGYTSDRGPREGFYGRWSEYVELKNCTLKNYTHANINLQYSSSTEVCDHYNIHNNYSTSNIAYGGRIVIDRGTYFLEFYNNTIDGSDVTNQMGGQNNHFHHNIIKDVKSSPLKHYHSGFGISVSPYAGEDIINNIYENNLIIGCESGGVKIENDNINIVENCIFRNNIFINNGKFVSHFLSYPQNQNSNIDLAIKISDPYDWDNSEFISFE